MDSEVNTGIVEVYRGIRRNIEYACGSRALRSFVVTSSVRFEGKSSIAANISPTLVGSGRRLILVDLDFRRPALHRFYGLPNDRGTIDLLSGRLELGEAIIKTRVPGVDLLPSGPVPIDPARLIESERLKDIVEALKKEYDIVVIDTPSAVAVSDAGIIGSIADGILYVIEPGKATAAMIWNGIALMKRCNPKIIGVVFNKCRREFWLSSPYSINSYFRDKTSKLKTNYKRED